MKLNLPNKAIALLSLFIMFYPASLVAQQRYYDEIFTEVNIMPDVQYGSNYTTLGNPSFINLEMDVYTPPLSDVVTDRPLIILLHTGNFLPPSINGWCTGTRTDSAVVELCTRFAKRGYVAAAVSYRLGWNPVSNDLDERTGTFINAVYRGLQDAKSAVRFFRNNALNQGNTYGINHNKIVLGGEGDGGSIALAYATLNDPSELLLDKFRNTITGTPYVNTLNMGDFDGFGGSVPNNYENTPGISSDVRFVFNIGGALMDSTWIQGGEVPIVSFHSPTDPFHPYSFGAVVVLTTGDFVIEVSGSHDIMRRANVFGNQDVLSNLNLNDLYSTRANSVNDGFEGLFPFVLPGQQDAPWEWWETSCTNYSNSLIANPDMSSSKGRTYIDSIMGYLSPRIIPVVDYIQCSAGFEVLPDTAVAHNWFVVNNCTGDGPLTYNWHWGDGDSSAGANPSHTYSTPGYYNICVSIFAANGCYDYYCDSSTYIFKTESEMISVTVIDGGTGIAEMELLNMNVYPNPASSSINIETSLTRSTAMHIAITNILGQTVYLHDENAKSGLYKKNIDLNFSKGIYYISLQTNEGSVVKKIEILN